MSIKQLLNPSTITGAFFIGFAASFFAGFFTGKSIERKNYKAKASSKGDGNIIIQNSKIGKEG